MVFRVANYPAFSWSLTRHRLFNECETCYALNYYVGHNGWLSEADPLPQSAYRIRKTKSVKDFTQEQLSKAIRYALYKEELTADEILKKILNELNSAFVDSRDNKKVWLEKPKHVNMLQEMIHTKKLDAKLVSDTKNDLQHYIDNFFKSQSYMDIKYNEDVEIIKTNPFGRFNLDEMDGLTVFCGLNVMYFLKGKYYIINFRTTDEQTDLEQSMIVAFFLKRVKNIDPRQIVIVDEDLNTGECKTKTVTDKEVENTLDLIIDSVNMMSEMLVDGDRKKNEAVSLNKFIRSPKHRTVDECDCHYCSIVEHDIRKYPQGYISKI